MKYTPSLVLSKDENILIRKANIEDIAPACELAIEVFMEFDSADYGSEHTNRMREALEDRLVHPEYYLPGNRLMYVACHGEKIVGVIETYGTNRISLMFVDGKYQRRGIATSLMQTVANELKKMGYNKIVLNASPKGVPFYKMYGFSVVESERQPGTPWKTPMELIF